MKNRFKNILLLLIAGLALTLGTVACSNGDDDSPANNTPATPTAKLIVVTNGTAGTEENVALTALANTATTKNSDDDKLYSDKECKTVVEASKAEANKTYYVKVTTVKVISVTGTTESQAVDVYKKNLSTYISADGRDGNLYSDKNCANDKKVTTESIEGGKTYYAKIPVVTVITVKNGTANAGEKVALKNLQAFVTNNGEKLYKALACAATDEITVASAVADGTYYVKISTVTVITVTNGTAAASGTEVQTSKLEAHVKAVTDGDKKLYSNAACTTEIAVTSVEAGKTYYVKVTSKNVKIIIVTDGVANAGENVDVSGTDGNVTQASVGQKLQAYLLGKGAETKLYTDQACTNQLTPDIMFAVAGNTYYAKIETKVTVIIVTNGTPAASGVTKTKAELKAYVESIANGDKKLYSNAACTTEIAVTNVTANTTYYVKVTTSTSGGSTSGGGSTTTPTTGSGNVYVITYYLMNESTPGDESSKTKCSDEAVAKDKLSEYLKYRGKKLYAKNNKTEEVTDLSKAEVGKTYYAFFLDSTPKVKVWKVKSGTESTGNPEFIKDNNDGGFDMNWIPYLDKYLDDKNVDTLYKWENNKKGAAVANSAVEENGEYCIVYTPAAAGTYTLAKDGKTYTVTTDAEGNYKMTEGTTEVENGKYTKTDANTLLTKVVNTLTTSYGTSYLSTVGGGNGAILKVTYTINGTTLTQKERKANYVVIIQSIPSVMDYPATYLLFSGVQAYLDNLKNTTKVEYKLYEDKAKTKEVSVSNLVGEKTYYAMQK